jgi:hypothetical protein
VICINCWILVMRNLVHDMGQLCNFTVVTSVSSNEEHDHYTNDGGETNTICVLSCAALYRNCDRVSFSILFLDLPILGILKSEREE